MFAFAIWDARRQRLFCARDRLGIKPFYYYWDGRLFAFASEIKALLEHPSISPALDEDVLPEMLAFGYTSGHRTLFGNIRKLMPAHRMLLDVGSAQPELKCERYWEIPLGDDCQQDFDEREWIPETRRRLEESVEMHLMSDVPLGVFLSGGLDSSAIAALAQRAISRPVETFAVGYSEARFSELSYARQTASALGANHREIDHRDGRFFWRAGQADLARRRADCVAIQRAALFRFETGGAACEGGADRRRQRRTVRRLRALSMAGCEPALGGPL